MKSVFIKTDIQDIDQVLNLAAGGKQILKGALGISGTGALYKDVKHYFLPIGILLVLLTLFVVQNLVNSRSGRAIMATRDNRIAAESVGIDVTKFKLLAFTISAALAGVAGVLYAHNDQDNRIDQHTVVCKSTEKFRKCIENDRCDHRTS